MLSNVHGPRSGRYEVKIRLNAQMNRFCQGELPFDLWVSEEKFQNLNPTQCYNLYSHYHDIFILLNSGVCCRQVLPNSKLPLSLNSVKPTLSLPPPPILQLPNLRRPWLHQKFQSVLNRDPTFRLRNNSVSNRIFPIGKPYFLLLNSTSSPLPSSFHIRVGPNRLDDFVFFRACKGFLDV